MKNFNDFQCSGFTWRPCESVRDARPDHYGQGSGFSAKREETSVRHQQGHCAKCVKLFFACDDIFVEAEKEGTNNPDRQVGDFFL
jgi:hypothetical protein